MISFGREFWVLNFLSVTLMFHTNKIVFFTITKNLSFSKRHCHIIYEICFLVKFQNIVEHFLSNFFQVKATLSAKVYKRAVRRGLTLHTCDICLKCFQKPSQLIRHRRIHTGEKPFKVIDCISHRFIKHMLQNNVFMQHQIAFNVVLRYQVSCFGKSQVSKRQIFGRFIR